MTPIKGSRQATGGGDQEPQNLWFLVQQSVHNGCQFFFFSLRQDLAPSPRYSAMVT